MSDRFPRQDAVFTVIIRNPRSKNNPYAKHVNLTSDDADAMVGIYLALGYSTEQIVVVEEPSVETRKHDQSINTAA